MDFALSAEQKIDDGFQKVKNNNKVSKFYST